MRILFLITALIIHLMPASAFAQSAPVPQELLEEPSNTPQEPQILQPEIPQIPESEVENALPFESYDDIPQEALDDAFNFYNYCKNDISLPTHYDCECWGSRYLEERIKLGPAVSRSAVMMKINRECFNIAGAANYAYTRCQGSGSRAYDGGMSPEEFCECIGNNYAILLQNERGFSMSGKKKNGLYVSATLRCRTPPPGVPRTFRRLDIDE